MHSLSLSFLSCDTGLFNKFGNRMLWDNLAHADDADDNSGTIAEWPCSWQQENSALPDLETERWLQKLFFSLTSGYVVCQIYLLSEGNDNNTIAIF